MTGDRRPLGFGIAGCGTIAGAYVRDLAESPEVELVAVADRASDVATAFAANHGTTAARDVDELLDDERIELLLNLTPASAHAEVTAAALVRGRHVYSEKPLAMDADVARQLVDLADQRGVRLAAAPVTWLGEAQQTAMAIIRSGALGDVRVAYADMNWGPIERWHPAPAAFYEAGPVFDVGVYPIAVLTAMFGGVRTVQAFGACVRPDRETLDGVPFSIEGHDWIVATLAFASGQLARLTCSFYVTGATRQHGIELHADEHALFLHDAINFHSGLSIARSGRTAAPFAARVRTPFVGLSWGRGVRDLARSVRAGRDHACRPEHACHVVEVAQAIGMAARSGEAVTLASQLEPAPLADWARAGTDTVLEALQEPPVDR